MRVNEGKTRPGDLACAIQQLTMNRGRVGSWLDRRSGGRGQRRARLRARRLRHEKAGLFPAGITLAEGVYRGSIRLRRLAVEISATAGEDRGLRGGSRYPGQHAF